MELFQGFNDLSLIFKLRETSQYLEAKLLDESGAKDDGLDFRQLCCLTVVQRDSEISISKLAEVMFCTQPAVTRIVEQLVAKGLLKKYRHKNDRRHKKLELTKKGSTSLERYKPKIVEFEQTVKSIMKGIDTDLFRVLTFFNSQLLSSEDQVPDLGVQRLKLQQLNLNRSPVLGTFNNTKSSLKFTELVDVISQNYPELPADVIEAKLHSINFSEILTRASYRIDEDSHCIFSINHMSRTSTEIHCFFSEENAETLSFIRDELLKSLSSISSSGVLAIYVGLSSKNEDVLRIFLEHDFRIVSQDTRKNHFGNLFLKKMFNDF